METSNVYQKHLTLDKRIKIEKGIEESKSFSQIGTDICKTAKTISNEIKRNRNIEHCSSWAGKFKTCEKTLKPPYVCNPVHLEKDAEKHDIITMLKRLKENMKEQEVNAEEALI